MLIDEVKAALEGATPGPWKWREYTQDGIVNVLEPYMCQGEGFIETSDANARLIALSPDMARALIAAEAKLVAAEEMAQAIADNAWRTDAEKAALAAYRRTEGETKAND